MKLGAYEFEWTPDEMGIPRPEKTTAVQPNLGNVGFFSWGPQLIGKEVKLKWKFTSIAQYEAFKALYLAGGVHVLDLTPETMFVGDIPEKFLFPSNQMYPAPGYEGVEGGPPYRRFWIGPVMNGPWPDIQAAGFDYNDGPVLATIAYGTASSLNLIAGGTTAAGHSFDAGAGGTLAAVYFRLNYTGTPPGNVRAKIYEHTGTFGSSSLPGALLATSDEHASTRTNNFWKFTFSGDQKITLAASTKYIVVLEYTDGNASNYQRLLYLSGGGYDGNAVLFNDATDTWSADTAKDVPFHVVADSGEFIVGETLNFSNGTTGVYASTEYTPTSPGNPIRHRLHLSQFNGATKPSTGATATGVTSGKVITLTSPLWIDNDYVHQIYQTPFDATPAAYGSAYAKEVNTEDPLNSYIDTDIYDGFSNWELPDFQVGSHVFDEMDNTWAVIIPYDAEVRPYYIYPSPILTTTKIYYDAYRLIAQEGPEFKWHPEVAGAGTVPYEVTPSDPHTLWCPNWAKGIPGVYFAWAIVTEVGQDAHGAWFKLRPVLTADDPLHRHDWEMPIVCGGMFMDGGILSNYGYESEFSPIIVPWGP